MSDESVTIGTTTIEQDWKQLRAVSARLFGMLVNTGTSPVNAANQVLSVVDDCCGGLSL